MQEYIVLVLLIIGAVFILIASIGMLKMPDVYLRMSASTIAATFGVASMLAAVAVHFADFGKVLHIIGVIIFLILTVPVGAHILARTAYTIGLKKWDKTVCDDMEGKYNKDTYKFAGFNQQTEQNNPAEQTNNKEENIINE